MSKSTHDRRFPNFFLIGAPKCGTTSLASWLSEHQRIFMCVPKEPCFFSTDIESIAAIESLDEYRSLFNGVEEAHIAIGEASTTYLRSFVAVTNILEHEPAAKFIVCLRNPIDMVVSVHAQLYLGGRESEADPSRAWTLQDDRRLGVGTEALIGDAIAFQYGENCLLGKQVERLLSSVKRSQIVFVFVEDLKLDSSAVYSQILEFLEVPLDHRVSFGIKNARSMPRFHALSRGLTHASRLKFRLGIRRNFGIGRFFGKLNRIVPEAQGNMLSTEFEHQLMQYFSNDISLLAELTGRDLTHWTNKQPNVT